MNNAITNPRFTDPNNPGVVVRWHVIGWKESVFQVAPGEPYRPAGCCDRCGQSIRYVVTVKSTLGDVMDVGQDCAVTLEGGPELAEIRRAEAAYQEELYRQSDAYKAQQERERARRNERDERRRSAEERQAMALAGLRAIIASGNCSEFEKDRAKRLEAAIVDGADTGVEDLDERDRQTLSVAWAKSGLPASRHTGAPGEKIERVALFEALIPIETAYGRCYIQKFRSADGAILIWKSKAGELGRDDLGKWIRIRGTVKSHTQYNGEPQTNILRCKTSAA